MQFFAPIRRESPSFSSSLVSRAVHSDPPRGMKRSLHPRAAVLLLIAIAAFLACKTLLFHGLVWRPISFSPLLAKDLNATLLRLAAIDFGEEEIRNRAEALLNSYFPSGGALGRRANLQWRRENHAEYQSGDIRSPEARPEVRSLIRQWLRSRRYDATVMSDLLRLVRPSVDLAFGNPNTGRPYASCAVVGNSGILLKSNHGDVIDSHDLVIRLNNAPIAGFSTYVGAKTNLSFVNSNVLKLCRWRASSFCQPYGDSVPMIMYICQAPHFLEYLSCNSSYKAPLLVTDGRFDALCARLVKYYSLKRFVEETGRPPEEWNETHELKMFHYSSGMQAVMLALGVCERVSVFGFGKSAGAKHHYHTNQKAELDLHDYEAEYALYRDLVRRPHAIPFLKDSGLKIPPLLFFH